MYITMTDLMATPKRVKKDPGPEEVIGVEEGKDCVCIVLAKMSVPLEAAVRKRRSHQESQETRRIDFVIDGIKNSEERGRREAGFGLRISSSVEDDIFRDDEEALEGFSISLALLVLVLLLLAVVVASSEGTLSGANPLVLSTIQAVAAINSSTSEGFILFFWIVDDSLNCSLNCSLN